MKEVFKMVLEAYGFRPEGRTVSRLGDGHIHDTYLVECLHAAHPPVVIQKINTHVFADVELLMRNMEIVTAHLSDRNRVVGKDPATCGIILLETEYESSWIEIENEGCWRMCWYIEDHVSFDTAHNADIAAEGGRVIGRFHGMLSDLSPGLLGETIPRFHDPDDRIARFRMAVEKASPLRKRQAGEWIAFSEEQLEEALVPYRRSERGGIPARIVHNDPKFNNILFDRSGRGKCMIDLDTVMSGFTWYDFGDALRTCASLAPEDETDLSAVGFRMDVFRGFARGYLEQAGAFLTGNETAVLHLAPATFAYMQGLRFLTDYLEGDTYYKTAYPDHNLVRTRAQYRLFQKIKSSENEMKEVIDYLQSSNQSRIR